MKMFLLAALALTLSNRGSAAEPVKVADWKTDPACRLVFHAVLEGLYEDGVTDDVVNNIVPLDKVGREKMRRSFVLDCPLCQPVFEAFCVYQSRPKFSDGSKASAFGKGLPEDVKTGLLSDNLAKRLITLRGPIKGWVETRLRTMKLNDAERQQWWGDIHSRSNQGTSLLRTLVTNDPWYKDWTGYWGCAACKGSEDATQNLRSEPSISPKK